jgi:hypothetical protein
LFPVFIDDADLARANTIIDANKGLGGSFIESDGAPPEGVRAGLPRRRLRRRQANASMSIASVWLRLPRRREDKPARNYAV